MAKVLQAGRAPTPPLPGGRLRQAGSGQLVGAVIVLALLVASLSITAAANPAHPTLVVATNGDDHAAGTPAHPMATIAAAVHRLTQGGTILLRAGHYSQRLTLGPSAHDLTIRPFRREHAILDGGGLNPPSGISGMVTIDGSSNVTVAGLDITGYDTVRLRAVPVGIYMHGGATHITLRGNHVHSMGNYNGTLGSYDLNAHGIAAYGDSATQPIHDLRIIANEVDHLALGASESVVVNGNVDGWRIVANSIHDNNNIGIDAIGYESTLTGPYRYSNRNRARHGLIADNTVTNIISRGNPAYYEDGSWCNCADGIYVDGGTRIRIERNQLAGNDIGIEVAAENPRGSSDHVVVADNFVRTSGFTGITTGGYCNGTDDCGGVKTGSSYANVFVNNTLYDNNTLDDGSPEFLIQYYTHNVTVENNVIYAANSGHVLLGTVPGAQRDGLSTRNHIDHNIYYASGGDAATASFGSLGKNYTGFCAYRRATGLDQNSRFAEPKLIHAETGDLHLRAGSPAIDAGQPLPRRLTGRLDVDRQQRIQGGRIDIGADERW